MTSSSSALSGRHTCLRRIAPGEDSLLERVTAAAEERRFSQNTKAALSLLCNVLRSVNPFVERLAVKFAPEKAELRFHAPHTWKLRYSTI